MRAALEKLMVLDWLGGYTEVFRPSNWFDHVALDTDAIAAGIKARYGHVFEIDVASFVEKLLAHHEALIILRGNMRHHPPLIGGFIKSWTEEPHHYRQRNPFESLKDQISSLRPEKDLAGVKHFLVAVVQPEFDEAVRGDAAPEVLSGIAQAFLDNPYINIFTKGYISGISGRHPGSLFIRAFRRCSGGTSAGGVGASSPLAKPHALASRRSRGLCGGLAGFVRPSQRAVQKGVSSGRGNGLVACAQQQAQPRIQEIAAYRRGVTGGSSSG